MIQIVLAVLTGPGGNLLNLASSFGTSYLQAGQFACTALVAGQSSGANLTGVGGFDNLASMAASTTPASAVSTALLTPNAPDARAIIAAAMGSSEVPPPLPTCITGFSQCDNLPEEEDQACIQCHTSTTIMRGRCPGQCLPGCSVCKSNGLGRRMQESGESEDAELEEEAEEEDKPQTLFLYTIWFSIASLMAMVFSIGNIVFFALLDFWTTPGTLYKNFCPMDASAVKGSASMKRFKEMGFPGCTIPAFCFVEKGKFAFAKYHGIWCMIAKLVPVLLDLISPCTGECGATTTAASVTSFGLVVGVMKMMEAAIQKLINALDSLSDNMSAAEILCKGGDIAERTKKSMKLAEIAGVGIGIAKGATAMLPGKLAAMFPFMEYIAAFGLMSLAFPRKAEGICLHAIALVDQLVITQVCNQILKCIPGEVQEMFDQMRLEIEEIRDTALEEGNEKLLEIMEKVEKFVLPVANKLTKVLDKTEQIVDKFDSMISQVEEKLPEEKRALLATVKEAIAAASKGLASVADPLREKKELAMALLEKVRAGEWGQEYSDKLDQMLAFLIPSKLLERLSNQLRADMYGVVVDQLQQLLKYSSKKYLKRKTENVASDSDMLRATAAAGAVTAGGAVVLAPLMLRSPQPPPYPPPSISDVSSEDIDAEFGNGIEAVVVSLTLRNMNYDPLMADGALLGEFTARVRDAIAAEAGHGVQPNQVAVDLLAGSVQVDARIPRTAATDIVCVQCALCASTSLSAQILGSVTSIPGIERVSSGEITVSEVSIAVSGERPKVLPMQAYLPTTLNETQVLEAAGENKFLAINGSFFPDNEGIAYRESKQLDLRLPNAMLQWGQSIQGTDEGDGWVRVQFAKQVLDKKQVEKSELMRKAVTQGMQYWEAKNASVAELQKFLSDQERPQKKKKRGEIALPQFPAALNPGEVERKESQKDLEAQKDLASEALESNAVPSPAEDDREWSANRRERERERRFKEQRLAGQVRGFCDQAGSRPATGEFVQPSSTAVHPFALAEDDDLTQQSWAVSSRGRTPSPTRQQNQVQVEAEVVIQNVRETMRGIRRQYAEQSRENQSRQRHARS